ncbi:cytotoxic necrotizing factor Rho-activating domain-containing protein [Photorhabdus temperata]|uniref:cytotoxic necrotizing factor Rho-activating domain-containing protein n=1 Tax=Photorhabdus temperata TaxID=574560 RepID=UPI000389DCC8|nr:cytotoxic necrotizing factor Rho-activating domain-containing protein [Photorhabdus temperata]EQB98743.1 putative insecticidal toxin complex protein [Photorhabdus temperata subsp. temperata M1021]
MFQADLHAGTPTLRVCDNRGLPIRSLQYHRALTGDNSHPMTPLDERITQTYYHAAGYPTESRDPRLFANGTTPNVRLECSLSGTPLRSDSVDAGWSLSLNDIEGRPYWRKDARGTVHTWQYELPEKGPGRLSAHFEQLNGGEFEVRERLVYGEEEPDAGQNNLRGQCVRHYDTAGCMQLHCVGLQGVILKQSRRLLKDKTAPVYWRGEDEGDENTGWSSLLETQRWTTRTACNAQGQLLNQTDAAGHLTWQRYNVAGQLTTGGLTPNGDAPEQILIARRTYSAAGQVWEEETGSGISTRNTYELQTQRLLSVETKRGNTLLQHIVYDYDPVGNIIQVDHLHEETRFFNNQQVNPRNSYDYDTLYQLTAARGREQVQQVNPSGQQKDENQRVNYQRNYSYDRGNNLIRIRHNGATQFTRDITVEAGSNRGVAQVDEVSSVRAENSFDACGNLQNLLPRDTQTLIWDGRNQLSGVRGSTREEDYLYGSGMRVYKMNRSQNGTEEERVVYLPGLELRSRWLNGTEQESWEVITPQDGVRVLQWRKGCPLEGKTWQGRYCYMGLLSLNELELDETGALISEEEYFPFGGTACWLPRNKVEGDYKTHRYSGKERDATGLYYYGYRYYMPWAGRWLNPDPAGTVDGLNLYCMVRNNPITYRDIDGRILDGWKTKKGVKQGDASKLKRKGPFYTKGQSDIVTDFSFARHDSKEKFDPKPQNELTSIDKRDVLETSPGDKITSYNKSSKWFAGTFWEKNPLSETTDLIVLHNGVEGAAGLKIKFDDLESNRSVLITGGTLTGCTMITGVKDSTFYALHAGTSTPSESWKTGKEGVRDNIALFNRLNPTDPIGISSEHSNKQLIGLLDHFEQGTLAYSGKAGFNIEGEEADNRILNYSKVGLGVSFTLISKNSQGVVSVETLLETGELTTHSPHKTKSPPGASFPASQLKYQAHSSIVHKLF